MTDLKNTLIYSLKSSAMRITPQRVAICQFLADSQTHPTALEIYNQLKPGFPSLSLATVYNTLDALVALGTVNALGSAGDGKVHFDARTEPHVNLACQNCHKVIDLHSTNVELLSNEIKQNSGFQLMGSRVLYYGICPDCQ